MERLRPHVCDAIPKEANILESVDDAGNWIGFKCESCNVLIKKARRKEAHPDMVAHLFAAHGLPAGAGFDCSLESAP